MKLIVLGLALQILAIAVLAFFAVEFSGAQARPAPVSTSAPRLLP